MNFLFYSTFIFLLVFFQNAFSFEVYKKVVLRDEQFNAIISEVALPDITSEHSYEGKYFKIVLGKSNVAIGFQESDKLQLKAATTYYHLSKARNFFDKVLNSSYVQSLPQITIRLDLSNVFNEIGHFGNDHLDPQFNNALTIPSGRGYEPRNIDPWGIEIWFRQSKDIDIRNFPFSERSSGSVKNSLRDFRNQNHLSSLEHFISIILQGTTEKSVVDVGSLMRLVGTSLILETIYQTSNLTADFFSQKIYRLDSALVPEIIYHEFAHVALSEFLELSHSTPVNEGLADFFAGKIANSKKLATKIKEYNLFSGKKVKKKQQYRFEFEQNDYANSDFVFGLLWSLNEIMEPELDSKFIFRMSTKLNSNSSIKEDLINASLSSCSESCKNPFKDKITLYKFFNSKNL